MPEVIFAGPEGRLEGRYHHSDAPRAPIAIILHPHPQHGGTMNNKVVYNLYYVFVKKGFSVLRFNFRGVGRSQGEFDNGVGELSGRFTPQPVVHEQVRRVGNDHGLRAPELRRAAG